jgi:predicted AAA+ superfamily ATPase
MDSEVVIVPRRLTIALPPGRSAFLWGPRQTGKTTWLRSTFPQSAYFDLLQSEVFLSFLKQPHLFREAVLALPARQRREQPIIVDEVQKVPALLDEVHWLIENQRCQFLLCGSSARKLRRGGVNLLGGRAWRYEMFPLTTHEVEGFDLLRALNRGLLPPHYFDAQAQRSLAAYVQDYLKSEVMAEGLVRNLPAFARFLDALGYSHGELVNCSNIARDCAVDSKTVRGYFDVLADTLLGRWVPPFTRRPGRGIISATEKFYLCDVGLAGHLCQRQITAPRGESFGRAFEHFILMELWAYRAYGEKSFDIHFWRTKSGLEVDFVLGGGEVAVETKGSPRVESAELRGLLAFAAEHRPRKAIVVSNEPLARRHGPVLVLPWREFVRALWAGEVL